MDHSEHVELPAAFVTSVVQGQQILFCTLSISVVVIYDWLLCLADEVKYVWQPKWSLGAFLYLFSRYATHANTAITLNYLFTTDVTPERCISWYRTNLSFTLVIVGVTELIPIWRTYALWSCNKRVLWFLLSIWFSWLVCVNVAHVKMNKTLRFIPSTYGGPGCHIVSWTQSSSLMVIPLSVVETAIVILTSIKCLEQGSRNDGALLATLHRDGVLFYALLSAISLATTVLIFAAPVAYFQMFSAVLRAMHTVLYCRVILNLRAAGEQDSTFPSRFTDVVFWRTLFMTKTARESEARSASTSV